MADALMWEIVLIGFGFSLGFLVGAFWAGAPR